jgi:hypothetical protein
MITDMALPKTFNNHLGFERGLWQRKRGSFSSVPKTSVLGRLFKVRDVDEADLIVHP